MPFDNTPGAATANSYPSVAEFRAYWSMFLARQPAWVAAATDPDVQASLMAATMLFDGSFDWTGIATDSVQALCWPRTGMLNRNKFPIATNAIPVQLKNAVCELAGQLGEEDLMGDDEAMRNNVSAVDAGDLSVKFQRESRNTNVAADIQIRLQQSEFNYISREIPEAVRRLLVDSWFNQPSIFRPLLFKAF